MAGQSHIEQRNGYRKRSPEMTAPDRYEVRVSRELQDPEWDAFLASTPGGHHVQSSLWAQVKMGLGWRAVRFVVTQGDQIVAGAQILMRPITFAGAIGYVPKGPLLAVNDFKLVQLVLNTLDGVARANKVRYLVVQPPDNDQILAQQLGVLGMQPAAKAVAPIATVMIDLTQELDDILNQMKSKTRYNIRLGQRKGVMVREGAEEDVPAFFHLLALTGDRQAFSSYPQEYFRELWRIFEPGGHVKLFVAECEGEAVSAALAIPFGDKVIYKRGGWSGHHGDKRPNEVLHWAAIRWAKSQGYQYYDFDGIDLDVARLLVQGEPFPNSAIQSVTRFKLGFGGDVYLFPEAYSYVYHPWLRWAYKTVFPRVANSRGVEIVLDRLRTTRQEGS